MRRIVLILAVVTMAVMTAAQEANPVTWGFGSPAVSGRTAPGASIKVQLTAAIKEGWHLYSLKKLDGGPIAARITLPDGQPFSLSGDIDASAPILNFDPVFEMEVEYYIESAEFTLPVRIAAGAKPGKTMLKISVRFQSCDEKLCLPPRTVTVQTVVEVAAK